jgi:hypothetical protein
MFKSTGGLEHTCLSIPSHAENTFHAGVQNTKVSFQSKCAVDLI